MLTIRQSTLRSNKFRTATNTRGGKAGLDQLWLNILLAMIGEQFDEGDEICGAVASVRARQEKIAL